MNVNYSIRTDRNGARFVAVDGSLIPVGIAGAAIGKHSWMRSIQCDCKHCGEFTLISELDDSGKYCEGCVNILFPVED